MLLLPIYVAIVTFACYRWRRRFLGFIWLTLALLGVYLLALLDRAINRMAGNDPSISFIRYLLILEGLMVLVFGGAVVVLPRQRAAMPCRGCAYELMGLEQDNPTCPECGLEHAARKPRPCAACRKGPGSALRGVCVCITRGGGGGACRAGALPAGALQSG